ncbi:MAG: transporter ATP-binding protein [Chthonomonadaceae bacterium]|nr:transporter ATP-binding protein [Chthonomonadaceae bacterium]
MSLVRISRVTKRYEDRLVLRDVSFRLRAGERVGLLGRNGAGKTTLLRMILGQEDPDEGEVDVNQGIRLGYFSQFSDLRGAASIQQVLEELFADLRAVEQELDRIGAELQTVTDMDEMTVLIDRQAHLLEEMEHRGGWDYPRQVDTVLTKLGFNTTRRNQPIDELSGGWRIRASLARILLEQPDVLLLDEPTNFLDVAGLAWLEEWLRDYRGGLLLVSHDRQFLDKVVTRVVEVENYHLHDYPGNYTHYVRTKPFRMKTLERQFEHEEELLTLEGEAASDREELARNPGDGVHRKLADIRKRRIPRPVDTIITSIYQGLRIPDRLCRAEDVAHAYGEKRLFEGVTLELARGERLGVIGSNGSGKSTLLRLLTGQETPDTGIVVWERGVTFADFNAAERGLDLKDTVTHAVNTFGGSSSMAGQAQRKHVNRFLALLQFSEMDLQQRIGTLSGGQKARVALAQCLLSGAQVLVLDEPTNHLDLSSTQVMEQALIHFPGAVVVVSHDRFFLDKVTTQLLVFEQEGPPRLFNGNWTMWQAQTLSRQKT